MMPAAGRALRRAAVVVAALSALGLAAGPPRERTLFRELAADEPVRGVLQAVFDSSPDRIRRGFTEREWNAEGFGAAWDKARGYFPNKAYFVRPGTYFMTHGFDPDGRLFMEIHDSDYLKLCVGNRRTFTAKSIVDAHGRMRAGDDGREAAAFREKTGRLELYWRSETAHRALRDLLGEPVYSRLLDGLRDEDTHMLAGGLVHEGMHAGVDDAVVARLQADFGAGRLPVQWDELRAFTAETVYHGRRYRWARDDISAAGREIEATLRELEALRRRPELRPGSDRAKFEKSRARSWAFAAIVRLRMRESWQSARRMEALAAGFRRDYVRGDPPAGIVEELGAQDADTAAFAEAFGKAAQAAELALRSLEEMLDLWTEWAEGSRPFPPPVTDSLDVVKRFGGVAWPDPPLAESRALMTRAKEALEAERAS
jgi:hypothetical protein